MGLSAQHAALRTYTVWGTGEMFYNRDSQYGTFALDTSSHSVSKTRRTAPLQPEVLWLALRIFA